MGRNEGWKQVTIVEFFVTCFEIAKKATCPKARIAGFPGLFFIDEDDDSLADLFLALTSR